MPSTLDTAKHTHTHDQNGLNKYFYRLAHYVLTHSTSTLLIVAIVSALSIYMIIDRIKVDNNLEVFAPVNSPILKSRDQFQKLFGRDDLFMISIKGDVFQNQFLKKIKRLEDEIQSLDLEIKSLGMSRSDWRMKQAVDPAVTDTSGDRSQPKGNPTSTLLADDWGESDEDDAWGDEKGGSIIEETTSLVSVRRTYQKNNSLRVDPWFNPIPDQKEIDRLKPIALKDKLLAQRLVDKEGTLTVILVRAALMLDDDLALVYEAIKKIVASHQSPEFVIRVTGPPAVNAALNELVLNDLSQLLLLSGIAMFIALIYLFRRPLMIIGPIVVVTISIIWTIGVMAYLDMGLNILSSILPAFLLCVGMGDSIHLQSIYKSKCKTGMRSFQATLSACALTGPPVLFTSLTTMIGLLSFQFATVTAVKDMGLAGGIGVFFALLHSLITLPIFLKWQSDIQSTQDTHRSQVIRKDYIDHVLSFLVNLSYKRRSRTILLICAVIGIGISLWGMGQLEVWHDDLETLPKNHPIKVGIYEVDRSLGGVASAQYMLHDSSSLGIKKVDTLQAIEKLSQHALAYKDADQIHLVGHTLSLVNIVQETQDALMPQQKQYFQSQAQASQLLNLFEFQSPEELKKMATIDLKHSYLNLQIKWREATSYQGFIEWMDQGIKKYIPPSVECQATGGIYLAYNIVSSLLNDLLRSFMGAFIVITLLMVLMFRSWKLGLLAMIPNLTPIVVMLGFLGILGIPLDLNNLLIASIALGIAVDDTIHLLHHFQMSYEDTQDCEQAIQSSITHAGRAMLSTSVLLFAGFIVYLAASTVAIQRFGVVIACTILLALVIDLLLCPAILRIAYRKKVG